MGYYRLYLLGGMGDHFVGVEEVEAPDDLAALRWAEGFAGANGLELWCGKRKVKSIAVAEDGPQVTAN